MAQTASAPRPDCTDELTDLTPEGVEFSNSESGVFRDVTHTAGDAEYGFDLCAVDAEAFEALLGKFDLPEEPVRFDKFRDDMEGSRLVWANERVMIVATAHPITGERVRHATTDELTPGHLGGVGIEGESETVQAVTEALGDALTKCKGESHERRFV